MAVRPCDDARGGESTTLVFPDLHSVNHLIRERRSLQDRRRGCRDVVDLQPLGRTRVGPDQIVLPADLRTREVVRRRRDRDSLVDAGTGRDAGGAVFQAGRRGEGGGGGQVVEVNARLLPARKRPGEGPGPTAEDHGVDVPVAPVIALDIQIAVLIEHSQRGAVPRPDRDAGTVVADERDQIAARLVRVRNGVDPPEVVGVLPRIGSKDRDLSLPTVDRLHLGRTVRQRATGIPDLETGEDRVEDPAVHDREVGGERVLRREGPGAVVLRGVLHQAERLEDRQAGTGVETEGRRDRHRRGPAVDATLAVGRESGTGEEEGAGEEANDPLPERRSQRPPALPFAHGSRSHRSDHRYSHDMPPRGASGSQRRRRA